jgi:hypothetical protein
LEFSQVPFSSRLPAAWLVEAASLSVEDQLKLTKRWSTFTMFIALPHALHSPVDQYQRRFGVARSVDMVLISHLPPQVKRAQLYRLFQISRTAAGGQRQIGGARAASSKLEIKVSRPSKLLLSVSDC